MVRQARHERVKGDFGKALFAGYDGLTDGAVIRRIPLGTIPAALLRPDVMK